MRMQIALTNIEEQNYQVCSSYGKYSTLISQDDLYIAGGSQNTSPVYLSVAFVIRVTYFPHRIFN